MVESLVRVWGFPNGYGAFLVDYLNDPQLVSQNHATSLLPLVGPLASGIMYCASAYILCVARGHTLMRTAKVPLHIQ